MLDRVRIKSALLSCWRKPAALELARILHTLGVSLVASGGTADALESAGLPVERTDKFTGFADLLKGRVKTLHPAIYAGILSRAGSADDAADLAKFDIRPFDLVVVDLYPFAGAVEQHKNAEDAVELIDIGGVALIRAAAKNFERVSILSRAEQYADFGKLLLVTDGWVELTDRRGLAAEALRWTAFYDGCIAKWLSRETNNDFPDYFGIPLEGKFELRYGENPHQPARFYTHGGAAPAGAAAAEVLGGKPLSFNNLLDLDIALRLPREFVEPAVAILKHTTPCGVGLGGDLCEAFKNARSTDPVSAFGGIAGCNRALDLATAQAMREGFFEIVAAPDYSEEAWKELRKSKNLRIIKFAGDLSNVSLDLRSVWGGVLMQKFDSGFPEFDNLQVMTKVQPAPEQLEALKFAWICVRYIKSNAILLAEGKRTVGIGAGQMSRVDAAHIAIWKARQTGLETAGCVAASDAFFPFRDGLDVLCDAGVKAVIQPGGSMRDAEVIAAADERGIVMLFTGRRHFRH